MIEKTKQEWDLYQWFELVELCHLETSQCITVSTITYIIVLIIIYTHIFSCRARYYALANHLQYKCWTD